MKFFLDINVVIVIFKGELVILVCLYVWYLVDFGIFVIVVYEFYYGVYKS